MGRIREYMAVGDMRALMAAGDPFRFRLPKALRKFQPGKALKKLAPLAASFIPGGGLLSAGARLMGGTTSAREPEPAPLSAAPVYDTLPYEEPQEPPWMQFMRAYGFDVGDPGPRRSAPKSKRKSAGAGPKAKASAKKARRVSKMNLGANIGASLKTGGKAAAAALPGLLQALQSGGPMAGMAHMAMTGAGPRGGGMGGGRRHINATNVKALRRGVRRIEAFERIVKSVHKAYPRIARSAHAAPRARSHRSGCKCFACRRAVA